MSGRPSLAPAGVPPSGNGKYVAVVVVLLVGLGAMIAYKMSAKAPEPVKPIPSAVIASASAAALNAKDEEVPLPPPIEAKPEAGADAARGVVGTAGTPGAAGSSGCEGKCAGSASPELEQAIRSRAARARACYNSALGNDPNLKGRLSIAVRIGPSGNVCSASVASNDMGNAQVGQCAANVFRQGAFPSPKGGCIDTNIPFSFVSQAP